ncbi:MAG TPA: maleylpyruvate isomerase N-terminal domain-containing protein [Candidatus Microbacterium pullistercoris]|nr:maleylpyruvate isomerase N-terminal domain-containing protein [Candidatus Microbacterium pullistercoris]
MPARVDNVADAALAAELLLARRGQAYFSRVLACVPDAELRSGSFLAGWTNARVVAHVALDARATAHAIEALRTGSDEAVLVDAAQRVHEIDFASTLPPEALRNLSAHAAVHLNVEWRDLPQEAWNATIRVAGQGSILAAETVRLRCREVWMRSVDLAGPSATRDLPRQVLERLRALPDPPHWL